MKFILIFLIRIYQKLKPLLDQVLLTTMGTTHCCKFQPSCSEYTIQMVRRHGIIVGLRKGMVQISRCW